MAKIEIKQPIVQEISEAINLVKSLAAKKNIKLINNVFIFGIDYFFNT